MFIEEHIKTMPVSIPQAVGVVATLDATKRLFRIHTVSIPQAVGVVATRGKYLHVLS